MLDPGAAVRTFLAGQRPLPNHTGGFTPQALLDAKVHDAWLVPGWHDPALAATLPTAGEVVTWCRQVLSPASPGAAAGWSLDLRRDVETGDATGERLRQHTTGDDLATHLDAVRARPSYAGVLPIPDVFIPDLWEGIAEGALQVTEATLDVAAQTATVFLSWLIEGLPSVFEVTLSVAEDAGAAHYVEATFQWIGAGVDHLVVGARAADSRHGVLPLAGKWVRGHARHRPGRLGLGGVRREQQHDLRTRNRPTTSVAAALPALTAHLRLLRNLSPEQQWAGGGLSFFSLLDVTGDAYSGVNLTALAVNEVVTPVRIAPITLPVAKVGTDYSAGLTA